MNTEHIVAKTDDLSEGQMKEVQVGEMTVLLVKIDGKFNAYASICPHQGAPLADGVLCDGRIRCPWHQTVYDARNGKLLQPPALDRLRHYQTHVRGDDVIVTVPDEPVHSVPSAMASRDEGEDKRTFAIVGTGAAGMMAAETLRHEGFRGRVVMITREEHRPYDRTELSKMYLAKAGAKRPFLRNDDFYENHDIELLTGREVTGVDIPAKKIACSDGEEIAYDRVLLATGASPRRPGIGGEDLENVFLLRSLDDCERIRAVAEGAESAVVIGASFIGMEVAASFTKRDVPVTVVAPETVPMERVFGPEIGKMYQEVHEGKGVQFRMGAKPRQIEGDGKCGAVVLESGDRIDADLVVIGVGVTPVSDYVSGVEKSDDGSISVDEHFRATEDVYVAGDLARWPDWRTGEPIRIEHWRLAEQLGRAAARNMAGKEAKFTDVPFFWTDQYMVITDYVGHAGQWGEIVYAGEPAKKEFVAYYVRDGLVYAAATCGKDREISLIAEQLRAPQAPQLDDVRSAIE